MCVCVCNRPLCTCRVQGGGTKENYKAEGPNWSVPQYFPIINTKHQPQIATL